MAKSEIIKELVNDEINIQKALYRLLLIANSIKDYKLVKWIESELNGYKSEDELPDYRIVRTSYITYSGRNGIYEVKNKPLPFTYIPEEYRENAFNNYVIEGVDALEVLSKTDKELIRDLTSYSSLVYKESGIRCFNISAVYDTSIYINILSNIKTRLIKVLLILEEDFGCLDNLDISKEKIDRVDIDEVYKKIEITIYDNSVKIGNGNDINKSNFNSREG